MVREVRETDSVETSPPDSQTSLPKSSSTIFSSEKSCDTAPLKRVFFPDPKHIQALYDSNNDHYQSYLKEIESFEAYNNLSTQTHSNFFFESNSKEKFQQFSNPTSKPKWFTDKLPAKTKKPREGDFFTQKTNKIHNFWKYINKEYFKKILIRKNIKDWERDNISGITAFKSDFSILEEKFKAFIEIITKNYFWLKNLFGNSVPICEKVKIQNQEKIYKHFLFINKIYLGKWYESDNFDQDKTIIFNEKWFKENPIYHRFALMFWPILHFNMKDFETYLREIIKRKILENFGNKILLLQKSNINNIDLNILISSDDKDKINIFYEKFSKFLPTHIKAKDFWTSSDDPNYDKTPFLTISLDKLKILTDSKGKVIGIEEEEIDEEEFPNINQDNDFNAHFFHLLKFALFSETKKNRIENVFKTKIDTETYYLFEVLINNFLSIKNAGLKKIFFGNKEQYLDLDKIQIKQPNRNPPISFLKTLQIDSINQHNYLEHFTLDSFQEVVKIVPYLQEKIVGRSKTKKVAFKEIINDNIKKKLESIFNDLKKDIIILERAKIEKFSLPISNGEINFVLKELREITKLDSITELTTKPKSTKFNKLKDVFFNLNKSFQYQKDSQPTLILRQVFINLMENKFKEFWNFLQPHLNKMAVLKIEEINYDDDVFDFVNLIRFKNKELNTLDKRAFRELNEFLEAVGLDYFEANSQKINIYNEKITNSFKDKIKTLIKNNFLARLPKFLKKFHFSKVNKLFLNNQEKQRLPIALKGTIDDQTFSTLIDEGKDLLQDSASIQIYDLTPEALSELFVLFQVQQSTKKSISKIFNDAIYRQYEKLWTFLQKRDYIAKFLAAKIFLLNLGSEDLINNLNIAKLDLSKNLEEIVKNIDTTHTSGAKQGENLIFIEELSKLLDINIGKLTQIFDSALNNELSEYLNDIKNSPLLQAGLSELKYPINNPDDNILLKDFLNVSDPAQLSAENLGKLLFFGKEIVAKNSSNTLVKIIEENIAAFWKEELAWFKHKENNLKDAKIKTKMSEAGISEIVISEDKPNFSKTLILEHFWNFSKDHPQYLSTLKTLKILFIDKGYNKVKLHQIFNSAINEKYQNKLDEFKKWSFKLSTSEKNKYAFSLEEDKKVSDFSIEELKLFLIFIGNKDENLLDIFNNLLKKRLGKQWSVLKGDNLEKLKQIKINILEITELSKDSISLDLTKLQSQLLVDLSLEAIEELEKLTDYSKVSIDLAVKNTIEQELLVVWSLLTNSKDKFLLKLKTASITTIPLNKINSNLNEDVGLNHLFLEFLEKKNNALIDLSKEALAILLKIKKIDSKVIEKLFQEKFATVWDLFSNKLEWREKLVAGKISELILVNKETINIDFWLKFDGDVSQLTSQNIADLVKLKTNYPLTLIKESLDSKFKSLIEDFSTKMWLLKILNWRSLANNFSIVNIKEEIADISIASPKKTYELKKETIEELMKFWNSDLIAMKNEITSKLNSFLKKEFQDIWNILKTEKPRLQAAKIIIFNFNNISNQIIDLNKFWNNSQSDLTYQPKEGFLVEFWEELVKLKTQISDSETLNNRIVGPKGVINTKLAFIWNLVQDYLKEIVAGETFSLTGKINFNFNFLAKKGSLFQDNPSSIQNKKNLLLELVDATIKPNILINRSLAALVKLDQDLDKESSKSSSESNFNLENKKKKIFQMQIKELLLNNFATVWEKISIYLQKFSLLNEYYKNPQKLLHWEASQLSLETFLLYKDSSELNKLLEEFVTRTQIKKTAKQTFISDLLLWKKKNLDQNVDLDVLLAKKINDNSLSFWTEISPWLKKLQKIGLREITFSSSELEKEIEKTDVSGLFKYLVFSSSQKTKLPSQFEDIDFAVFLKFFPFTINTNNAQIFFKNKINAFLEAKLAIFQKPETVAKIKSLGKDQDQIYQDLQLDTLIDKTPSQLTPTQFNALIELTKDQTVAEIESSLSEDITGQISTIWNWIKPFLKKINIIGFENIVFIDKDGNNINFDARVLKTLKLTTSLNNFSSQVINELNKLNSLANEEAFIEQLTDNLNSYKNLRDKLLFFQGRTGDAQKTLLIEKIKISKLYDIVLNKNKFNIKSLLETEVNSVIELVTGSEQKNNNTLDVLVLFKDKTINEIIALLITSIDKYFSDARNRAIWAEFKKNIPSFKAIQTDQWKLGEKFLNIKSLKDVDIEIVQPSDSAFTELAYLELEKIRQAITKEQIINIDLLNDGYQDTITNSLSTTWQQLQPWLTKFFHSKIAKINDEDDVININLLIAKRKISQVYQLNADELKVLFSLKNLNIDAISRLALNHLLVVWKKLFPYLDKLNAVQISEITFINSSPKRNITVNLEILNTKLTTLESTSPNFGFFQLEKELETLYQIYQNKKTSENSETFAKRVLLVVTTSIQNTIGNKWQKLIPFLIKLKYINQNLVILKVDEINLSSLYSLEFKPVDANDAGEEDNGSAFTPLSYSLTASNLEKVYQIVTFARFADVLTQKYLDIQLYKNRLIFLQSEDIREKIVASQLDKISDSDYETISQTAFKSKSKPSQLTIAQWESFINLIKDKNSEAEIAASISDDINREVLTSWEKIKDIITQLKIVKFPSFEIDEITFNTRLFFSITLSSMPVFTSLQIAELKKIPSTVTKDKILELWKTKLNSEGELKENWIFFQTKIEHLQKSALNELTLSNGESINKNFWNKTNTQLSETEEHDISQLNVNNLTTLTKTKNLMTLKDDLKKALETHLNPTWEILEKYLLILSVTEISILEYNNKAIPLSSLMTETVSQDAINFVEFINMRPQSLQELSQLMLLQLKEETIKNDLIISALTKKLDKIWKVIQSHLPNIKVVFSSELIFQINLKNLIIKNLLIDFDADKTALIDLTLESLKELLQLSKFNTAVIEDKLEDKFSDKFSVVWDIFVPFLEKFKASNIDTFTLSGTKILELKKIITLDVFNKYVDDKTLLNDFQFFRQTQPVLENLTKIVSFLASDSWNVEKFKKFLEKLIDAKFLPVWNLFKNKIDHLEKSQISNFVINSQNVPLKPLFIFKNIFNPHQLSSQVLSSLLIFSSQGEVFTNTIDEAINTKLQPAWNFLKNDFFYLKALEKTEFILKTTPSQVVLTILPFQNYWNEAKEFKRENTKAASLESNALQELVKFYSWTFPRWSSWLNNQKKSTFDDQWTETFKTNLRRLKVIDVNTVNFQGNNYNLAVIISQADENLANLNSQSLDFLKSTSPGLKNDLNNLHSPIVKRYIREKFQTKWALLKTHLNKLSILQIKNLNLSETGTSLSLTLSIFAEKNDIDSFWAFPDLQELTKLNPFTISQIKMFITNSLEKIIGQLKTALTKTDYLAKWKNLGIAQLFIETDEQFSIATISEDNIDDTILNWQIDTVKEFNLLLTSFFFQKKITPTLTEAIFWKKLFNKTLEKKFSSSLLIWKAWKEKINISNLIDLEIPNIESRINVNFLNELTTPFADWNLTLLNNLNAFADMDLLKIIKNNINQKFFDILNELTVVENNFLARLFILKKQKILLFSAELKEQNSEESVFFNLNLFYNWILNEPLPLNSPSFVFKDFSSFEELNKSLMKIFNFATQNSSEFSSNLLKELVKITKNKLSLKRIIEKTINLDAKLKEKLEKLILIKAKLLNFPEIWNQEPKKYSSLVSFLNEIDSIQFLTELTLKSTWVLKEINFVSDDVFWKGKSLKKTINDFYQAVFQKIFENKERLLTLNLKKIKLSNFASASPKVIDLEPLFQSFQESLVLKTFDLAKKSLKILKTIAIQNNNSGKQTEATINKNINDLYQKIYEAFFAIKPILNLINKFVLPIDAEYEKTVNLKPLTLVEKTTYAADINFQQLALLKPFLEFGLDKSLEKLLQKNYKKELKAIKTNYQRLKIAQLSNLYLDKKNRIFITPIIKAKKETLTQGSFDELFKRVKIFAQFKNKNINRIVNNTLNRKYAKKWKFFQPFLSILYNADIKTIKVNTETPRKLDDLLENKDQKTPAEISDAALQELVFFAGKADEEIKQLVAKEIKNKYTKVWKFLSENYQIFNEPPNSLKTFSQKNNLDLNKMQNFLANHKDKAVEELPAPVFLELQKIYDKDMKKLLIKPNKSSDSFFTNEGILVAIFLFVILSISILGIYIAVSKRY